MKNSSVNFVDKYQQPHVRLDLDLLHARTSCLLDLLGQTGRLVSVVLLDDKAMAGYNRTYRGKKGATNVLSFPADDLQADLLPELVSDELGDILISVDTAVVEAGKDNKSLQLRLIELIIHGMLHLLGYDHEESQQQAVVMQDKERKMLTSIIERIPDVLSGNRQRVRSGRKNMPHLAINVDHVATIRQARGGAEPDPVLAAGICELAGAKGIVVHLREDRRHIQDRDIYLLRDTIKTRMNLEMANVKEIVEIALDIVPDMITLVPEKRKELTTEGGLDVIKNEKKLRKTISKMRKAGIPVSIFIDPDASQIEAALEVGATYVELHTGRYCDAKNEKIRDREFHLIEESAELAFSSGLRVNAGHGLDYRTTTRIAALDTIEELSIGHAIMARAIFVGLDQAVREMQDCITMAG